MNDGKEMELIKRLKELQAKCLPDYDADEKTLHFKWYIDTPDAMELARLIIDLDEQMTAALTELAEIKKRAEHVPNFLTGYLIDGNTMQEIVDSVTESAINYILKGENK